MAEEMALHVLLSFQEPAEILGGKRLVQGVSGFGEFQYIGAREERANGERRRTACANSPAQDPNLQEVSRYAASAFFFHAVNAAESSA